MKKNLGKSFLFVLLTFASLHAQELASYTMQVNKKEAYVKEAIEIIFTAKQLNNTTNMFFFLETKKSAAYKIYLLKKESKELSYHNSTATFKYILFGLEPKDITVNFNFIVKTASDKAVKQAYVADHDDSIAINMSKQKIVIKPLVLHIKALQKQVDFVGDFQLKTNIDTQTINQYESVNLVYTLTGQGFAKGNFSLLPKIPHVTQFFENDNDTLKLTKNGFTMKKRFIYSLSAQKDFTIPAIRLQAYSPTKKHYYQLLTPTYHIIVKKIPLTILLDKKEYPQSKSYINIETLKQFSIYLLIFIIGFITAKITNFMPLKNKKKKEFQDIKESQTAKELIFILLNHYRNKNIDKFIQQLETLEYKGEGDFKGIKKGIIVSLQ